MVPEFVSGLRKAAAVEGKSARFECEVSGQPKPDIQWSVSILTVFLVCVLFPFPLLCFFCLFFCLLKLSHLIVYILVKSSIQSSVRGPIYGLVCSPSPHPSCWNRTVMSLYGLYTVKIWHPMISVPFHSLFQQHHALLQLSRKNSHTTLFSFLSFFLSAYW